MSGTRDDAALARALVQGAFDLHAVTSATGTIQFVNAAARTVLGYAPEELVGTSGFELVHPDDVPIAQAALAEVVASTGVSDPVTVRVRRKDGSWIYAETIAVSRLEDPEVGGVLLNTRDVTDRIRASERLEDSEARFHAVFEQVRDGVVLVDPSNGTIFDANRAASAVLGRGRHELVGASIPALLGTTDERRDAITIKRPDGAVRYVDWSSSPLEVPGSEVVLGVLRDVTTQLEAERAKERFFAMIAHELRTPVAVLTSSIEVLRSQLASLSFDDQKALLAMQKEEILRLGRIVSDVLDLAAIQSGRLSLRAAPTALAPVVASAAARVGTQFGREASLDLEPVDALVDVGRFEQVVTNLLDNAWRHGGQRVTVRLRRSGGFAAVAIDDDGPGIADGVRERLFDRYYVVSDRPTSGIGIGLWLSKQLVRAMAGEIAIDRPAAGGTSVVVNVPVADLALTTASRTTS